jgi:hypothetical protein
VYRDWTSQTLACAPKAGLPWPRSTGTVDPPGQSDHHVACRRTTRPLTRAAQSHMSETRTVPYG